MVKNNDYPKRNLQKDGVQANEPAHSNSQPKAFHHKENYTRNNNRPIRETQQKDNLQRDNQKRENGMKDNQQRISSQRENTPRESIQRENTQRENTQRENTQRENTQRENTQRENTQRDNTQRENQHRENQRNHHRDQFRPYYQRPVIKPRTDETVEDIATDIVRIEKEIELELKEIKSMRLGV